MSTTAGSGAGVDSFDERWAALIHGSNLPLNLADEFSAVASRHSAARAVVRTRHTRRGHTYESLTFGECLRRAEQYTHGFRTRGIGCGDTALILMKPMLDIVPVFLALWKIGAVPLVVDPGAGREQKLRSIEQIAPNTLIGIPLAQLLRLFYPRTFRSIRHTVVAGRNWFLPGATLSSLRNDCGPAESTPSRADDPLAIVFTSGSTGAPKGVLYTQGNGAAVIQIFKEALQVRPGDVCLACHPVFSMYFVGLGGTVVLPDLDPRFPALAKPDCLFEVIQTHQPRIAFMQLPVLQNLCRYCMERGVKLPHLEKILTTGASVSPALIESAHAILENPAADVYVMYGATEALSVCFASGRSIVASGSGREAGTYLGRPSAAVKVRIIGITDQPIENWRPELALPPYQIGEICVSGPVATREYRNRPEATRHAKIPDAPGIWHRMGDAGYQDEQGNLWYCGRLADRVETEEGPLYSDLIEPVFNRHPKVRRSALVGVPVAYGNRKRPVLLVEPAALPPAATARQALAEELKRLAAATPATRAIADVLLYERPFPVDIRHNAKIRRDLLAREVADQLSSTGAAAAVSGTVDFRGHRLAYVEQGRGETMLFLHNAGNDHHIWDFQFEHFARTHRVVAVDSLGYGASDRPALEYTLPLYTEMVAAVVDALSLAPVTIVATCTGASMALNYALQNAAKVRRLVLFHIATQKTAAGGSIGMQCSMLPGRPRITRLLAAVADALTSRGVLHRALIRGQYGRAVEAHAGFIQHLQRLYSRKGQMRCLLNLFSNWPTFAVLDEVAYPAHFPPLDVFWGGANQVLPVARGRELCRTLQPRSFTVIESGGHLVMREEPQWVNRSIEHLLAGTRAVSG